MPRLAVTLRRFAQFILRHLDCASCASCRPLLAVPLHEEGRCLHLFDIRATLSTVEVKAALVALLGDAAPEFVEELRAEPDQEPPPPLLPAVLTGHVSSLPPY
jgi:hypothetical protein